MDARKAAEFIEQIARMTPDQWCRTHDHDADTCDCCDPNECDIFEMPTEDALGTLNELIVAARALIA